MSPVPYLEDSLSDDESNEIKGQEDNSIKALQLQALPPILDRLLLKIESFT
jgi:hypothetical protein